jgi:hypothetical protein
MLCRSQPGTEFRSLRAFNISIVGLKALATSHLAATGPSGTAQAPSSSHPAKQAGCYAAVHSPQERSKSLWARGD